MNFLSWQWLVLQVSYLMYVSPLVVSSPPFDIPWAQSRMCHCTRFFFLGGGGGGGEEME